MSKMRVAGIGAGMKGLISTYVLAKEGVDVLLYEKENYLVRIKHLGAEVPRRDMVRQSESKTQGQIIVVPRLGMPLTEASGAPLLEIRSFKQVLMEKATPFCLWGFLNLEEPQIQLLIVTVPENEVVIDVRPSKSYAAVLKPKYGRNIDISLLSIPGRQLDVDLSIMSKNQRKRWRRKNTNGASSFGSKENGVALCISTENTENLEVVPSENQADKHGDFEENVILVETEGGNSVVVAEAIVTEQIMDVQNNVLPSKELVVETSAEILPCIEMVEVIGHGSEQGACEISPEGILEIVLHGPTEAAQVEISQVQENVNSEPTWPTKCTGVQGVEPNADVGVHTLKEVKNQILCP
ncbi:hypothetical protein IFM89_033154 [Coptis chinensis]|uniref:Uncharacterized protein n=1 Tax=Coptis chinensis TaxID=261450 RepID=A0A835M7X6_9MAGN|nr:hypothetical protein IFM89_033154 [Coptis chinensis]